MEDVKGKDVEETPHVFNPEEGWDDDTDPMGVVLDYLTREEVARRKLFHSFLCSPNCLV